MADIDKAVRAAKNALAAGDIEVARKIAAAIQEVRRREERSSATAAPAPQGPRVDSATPKGASAVTPEDLLDRLDQFEARKAQSGPTPDDLLARLDEFEANLPQAKLVATTRDGEGKFYKDRQGNISFTSPGYSTSDPAKVQELIRGAKPVDIVQRDRDEDVIAANPVASRALKAVEGTPFIGSYADEAVGVVSPQARDNMRETSDAMERQRPGQSAALGLAGTVAASVPMAMAAAPSLIANAGRTVGVRALQGLGVGAAAGGAEGALYGAGEGTDGNRGNKAMWGGALGVATGGALGLAAPYASAGLRSLLGRLKTSDVATIAKSLGISRPAATVVRDALEAGGIDDAMRALDQAGEGAMLADAGQPARQLLDAAAAAGGASGQIARRAVGERTREAASRMTGVLDRILGAPQGERELMDAVRNGTAPARRDAYERAYFAPIDYSGGRGRALEALLQRVPSSAIRRAQELMDLEGVESSQILARIGAGGRVSYERLPDVRQIDYITRALNDVAAQADGQGKLGGTTDLGRATSNLSKQLRSTLRNAVPEYGAALDTAADAITERNAVETGYSLLRSATRREEVARALGNASKAERQAAKQGLRAYLDDTLANVRRTVADPDTDSREGIQLLREFSSRASRDKLRLLLGRDQAEDLIAEIDQAATAFELRAAIAANSKTAIRQSIQGGIEHQSSQGLVRLLAAGEPIGATRRLVQALTGETAEAQELRRMGLYEEIARALTEVRGGRARSALSMIKAAMDGRKLSEAQASFISTVLASSSVALGAKSASSAVP